jgi:hypothetical protein
MGASKDDPASRLVELMAAPHSTDRWERRRGRAIVLTIVSVLLAVLVASVLVVAYDCRFIRVMVAEPRRRARA